MIKFKKQKIDEELKIKIDDKERANKAYRISKEMQELAADLLLKAEQLERELKT